MTKKGETTIKKSEATKELIRKTTKKLVDQYGNENVTIRMICQACHLSVGSFYNYYESKEQIFIEDSMRNDELFEKQVKSELKEDDSEKYIRKYFSYYAEMNIRLGTDLYMRTYRKQKMDVRLEQVRPMYTVLEDYIREKQRQGQVRAETHPVTIVHQLFMVVRAVVIDWCIGYGRYDLNREVQDILTPMIAYFVIK